MFDLDQFIADCRNAHAADRSSRGLCEVVRRAVSDSGAVVKTLGEPKQAALQKFYSANDLTILNVIWTPRMMIMPHNHHMGAIIGVYGGREDSIFWRRVPDARNDRQIEAAAAHSLGAGEVNPLGEDIIHSVVNPTDKFTAAIHVYRGDFFAAHRSEWDPDTLSEQPSSG